MKLSITTLDDKFVTVEVADDMDLDSFKCLCSVECGIETREVVILHEGRPLLDGKKSLNSYGIKEGDILLVHQVHFQNAGQANPLQNPNAPSRNQGSLPFNIDFSQIQIPGASNSSSRPPPPSAHNSEMDHDGVPLRDDPVSIRDMLLRNPDQIALLKQSNPRLADALLSGSAETFASVLMEQQKDRLDRERLRIRMMNADPFDLEAQKLIAEEIKQENINVNMEAAMEYHPESFGQVTMLYINCTVNGHPVKAFIDSGAQTTIMSQQCADRCNIMRLVDTRWAGLAKGVGTQKIIGRVHVAQIQIGNDFLTSSFSILEEQPMDMLLGLDMLKRHQCCIDLKRNVFIIGTTGTETNFLSENELPECVKMQSLQNPGAQMQEHEDQMLAEALTRSVNDQR